MTTRQAWAAARVFASAIGLPPGGMSLTTEAAWRVVMLVRMYEESSEILWRRTQIQALVSGNSQEGFDAVARAFRLYRETATPWLEEEREKSERELRSLVTEMSKEYTVSIQQAPPEIREKLRKKFFG